MLLFCMRGNGGGAIQTKGKSSPHKRESGEIAAVCSWKEEEKLMGRIKGRLKRGMQRR